MQATGLYKQMIKQQKTTNDLLQDLKDIIKTKDSFSSDKISKTGINEEYSNNIKIAVDPKD